MQVDRHHAGNAADDCIAAGKDAAVDRAVADRHHPFGIRRRRIGARQRLAHVLADRPRHHQHVGVARGSDEAQAEALEIVEGVAERVDLQLAAVARAGIDLADREAAAETPPRGAVDLRGELRQHRLVPGRWRFRQRAARQAFEQGSAHGSLRRLEIVPGIGAVERFVAEREIGNDVALDGRFQQGPLEPGRIAQVASCDAITVDAHPCQNVAPEGLDQA